MIFTVGNTFKWARSMWESLSWCYHEKISTWLLAVASVNSHLL